MDSMWVVLTALAFGIFLGAAFMIVLHVAERRGSSAAKVVAPTIPDGIDQVLEVLESAGVVLDPSNNVLKASPGALALGLVRQHALAHPELLDLVASVRRSGATIADEIDLARGPYGEGTIRLRVLVARLGTRFVLLLAEDRTEAIGVFSSWLMFATKSRRTSSRRCASVRSSARRRTNRVPSRATSTRSRTVPSP